MSFLSNLFGGNNAPQVQFTPSGLSNPTGFNVSGGNISNSPTLNSNIGGLQQTFSNQASAFGNLAKTVAPGFSQLRKAGLAQIGSTFRANRSNLQQNLAQRRILGSSFANSAFSENAANEAQAKSNFEAQSYLQELQSSMQLVQQQYQAQSQSYSTAINQSNIEAQIGAQLTAQNNQIGSQIAEANAQLTAQSQAGAGSFLGSLIGAGAQIGSAYMGSQATSALASALLAA